jgi:acyl-CoA synthetase (AMP-forming)/AMP-acid ligase II
MIRDVRIPDRSLLQWLDDPDEGRGMHFARASGEWEHWPYPRLADLTLRVCAACAARGVRRGDVVAVIQRCSPGFVASMFGTFAAGASACSIAPPFAYQRADDYERHLAHVLSVARPALVIGDEESVPLVDPIARQAGLNPPVTFAELIAGQDPAPCPLTPADVALVQFTSGSSGYARGVQISPGALEANVNGMRRWLRWQPADPGANWLPVHHDMGLIGSMINFVVQGCDGWMLQPEDFIRSPLRYLTCISEQRVKLTPMPNFGLAYTVRRVRPADLEGLSFESVRAFILGAERIDPRVLTAFEQLLAPFGLRHSALVPAYGGAEATLAATGLPVTEGWITARPEGAPADSAPVVGCGRPLDRTAVRIEDEQGTAVPDGVVGEIVVSGASMALGYLGDPGTASGTSLADGVLRTGDAGFLRDGQLFVLGRLGDGLKVRGRMVFAESLEAQLCRLGIPERRVSVLLGVMDGKPTAAVVFELPKPGWPAIAEQVLREQLEGVALLAVSVRRGGLAVTSSGKPRRRVMWRAFCDGTLAGEISPLSGAATSAMAGAG